MDGNDQQLIHSMKDVPSLQHLDRNSPLNSQNVKTLCLQQLASSLELPADTTPSDLRQTIEGKLSEMKCSPQSFQGVLQQTIAGAILHLMDAYGLVLDTEPSDTAMEQGEDDTMSDVVREGGFHSPIPHSQLMDSFRLQLQALHTERDQLEETVLSLRESFEREQERVTELQQVGFENESLLETKNKEIELLQRKVHELETQNQTTPSSPPTQEDEGPATTKRTLRKSARRLVLSVKTLEDGTQASTTTELPNSKWKGKNGISKSLEAVASSTTSIQSPTHRWTRGKTSVVATPSEASQSSPAAATPPVMTRLRLCEQGDDVKPHLHQGGYKPYKCEHCGKAYTLKHDLTIHLRQQHTGGKVFTCKLCKLKVSRADALRRHMRIHTKDKPYECEYCGKLFSQTHHLQKHLRGVHKGKT